LSLDQSLPEASANQPVGVLRQRVLTLQETLAKAFDKPGKLIDMALSKSVCPLCRPYFRNLGSNSTDDDVRTDLEDLIVILRGRVDMIEETGGIETGPLS
jgi:hypothetical protein